MRFSEEKRNKEYIEMFCHKQDINGFTINSDNTVDVNGNVYLFHKNWAPTKIPIKFKTVHGTFDCSYSHIYTLENVPLYVYENFICVSNEIRSMQYCPIRCNNLIMRSNKLLVIDNMPEYSNYLDFSFNKIFDISLSNLNKVKNFDISIIFNPIHHITYLFSFNEYLDYKMDYNFQNRNTIYKTRFMEALNEFKNIDHTEYIDSLEKSGYKFI